MLIDEIVAYLREKTGAEQDLQNNGVFTAESMASVFNAKRNTISHYCNKAVNDGILFKINSRPVYFYHREQFAKRFHPVQKKIYLNVEELNKEKLMNNYLPDDGKEHANTIRDAFSELVGYSGSLRQAIEQIKTSLFYPTNRLPIILTGPTGAGKTCIAKLMHQFSIDNGILTENAPFVLFNCAQYADNPELLSSNLFGYVKGAFTGAYTTTKGMLEAADKGILFLDEVHRLNRESQEKLFTFIDQGVYRRIGESEGWHHVDVRLVLATTEKLTEIFLETFLRRIPIQIHIPPLEQRGYEEKLQFINWFFLEESRILKRKLNISGKVIQALIAQMFKGNVGALQSTIKLICGTSFSRQRNKETLQISLPDLPDDMLFTMLESKNGIKVKEYNNVVISPDTDFQELYGNEGNKQESVFDVMKTLSRLYENKLATKQSNTDFERDVSLTINDFLDNLIYYHDNQNNTIMQFITSAIQEVSRYMEYSRNIHFNGNAIFAMATYFYYRSNDYQLRSEEHNALYKYIQKNCKQHLNMAKNIVHFIENKVDIQLKNEDEILFTFYLKNQFHDTDVLRIRAIIIAHGYATASSIANVVNRMIDENLFEAFDMPIDSTSKSIVDRVRYYIEQNDTGKGLVILVDMGSLQEIYTPLQEYFRGAVAIINNVSTQMALHVGHLLQQGAGIEGLVDNLQSEYKTEYKIMYPNTNKQKCLVACCITGIGAANQIRQLLIESVPDELELTIISMDYNKLKGHGTDDPVFKLYDVLCIIGTVNPYVKGVPYIALEDMISGNAEENLLRILGPLSGEQIKELNDNLVQRFSLERLIGRLTILDVKKVLQNIEKCIVNYEEISGERISNRKRAAVYFHVSCMVERIIRSNPEELAKEDKDTELSSEIKAVLPLIQKAFCEIEEMYMIKIPLYEWEYIVNIMMVDL